MPPSPRDELVVEPEGDDARIGAGADGVPAGPAAGPEAKDRGDEDPIVAEVRAIREALFAAAGYDLEEFCRQIRASEVAEGRTSVVRPPRTP